MTTTGLGPEGPCDMKTTIANTMTRTTAARMKYAGLCMRVLRPAKRIPGNRCALPGAWGLLGAAHRLDDHVLGRHIAMAHLRSGLDGADLVDNVDALDDLAEDRVADLVAGVGAVEALVVHGVDVELRRRAVG